MSKNRSLGVMLALGLSATSTRATAQTTEAAAPVDPGKAAYVRGQCDFCHGPNGNGAMGPGLVPFAKGPGYLLLVVRQGLGLMPAHAPNIVSDEDVRAIYRFLRVDPSAKPAAPAAPPKRAPRPRRR